MCMIMRVVLVAVLWLGLATSAGAYSPLSVGGSVDGCRAAIQTYESGGTSYDAPSSRCIRYFAALRDVFTSYLLRWPVCPPPGLSLPDVIKSFLTWADRNPKWWDEPLLRGALAALDEDYPC